MKVEGGPPPPDGQPWTTYLAGQRLAKLIEAGYVPVSVAAAVASVRVWAYCITEYLMEGLADRSWRATRRPRRSTRSAAAQMAVRRIAREHVRSPAGRRLAPRVPRWSSPSASSARATQELQCILRGNRVRRFKDFDPMPTPRPDGAPAVSADPTLGAGPTRSICKAEMRAPPRRCSRPGATEHPSGDPPGSMTSDLSIDEELLLHSIGWEPVELVCGVSLYSVPMGVWNWGQGEIGSASDAYAWPSAAAKRPHPPGVRQGGRARRGRRAASRSAVHRHHIDVTLVGTAVRPVGVEGDVPPIRSSSPTSRPATSPCSQTSGWAPLGLAVGASFVYAPRRSAGAAIKQKGQNVELTNFTEAMYSAREPAMERMQTLGHRHGRPGVVEVKVTEGPMDFARHAIGFAAWGTSVRLRGSAHQYVQPQVVLPLDDVVVEFAAESLRGQ